MSIKSTLAGLSLVAAIALAPCASIADNGEEAVRTVLMATFDKPEARLVVDPIVVERDIAVASWTQGETGGRALLRRKHETWSIVLCGGDGLKEAAALEDFGLSVAEATALAGRIVAAEASVPEDRKARFSLFERVMRLEHAKD